MRRLLCFRPVLLLACAALLFVGCGVPAVKVDGKLVKDGKPFTPPTGQTLALSFVGKGAGGEDATFAATINTTDGSYQVNGPTGAGIPPGTYKVRISTSVESTDPASLNKMETLNGQFAVVNQKECVIEAGGAKTITIDLGKGTVSK
jgi:hypothetical protein